MITFQLPPDVPVGQPEGPFACRAMVRGQTLTLKDCDTYIDATLSAPMAGSAMGVPVWVHGAGIDKADMQARVRATLALTPADIRRWSAAYGSTTPAARVTAWTAGNLPAIACAGLGVVVQAAGVTPALALVGAGWIVARNLSRLAEHLRRAVPDAMWQHAALAGAALGGREVEVAVPATHLREVGVAYVDHLRQRVYEFLPRLRELDELFNLSESNLRVSYTAPNGSTKPGDVAFLRVEMRPDPTKVYNCVRTEIEVQHAGSPQSMAVAGTLALQAQDPPVLTRPPAPAAHPTPSRTITPPLPVKPAAIAAVLSPPPSMADTYALIDLLHTLHLDGRVCLRDVKRDVASHLRFTMRAHAYATVSTVAGQWPHTPTEFHFVPEKDAIQMRACLKKHAAPVMAPALNRQRVRMSPTAMAERFGYTIAQHMKKVFEAPGIEMTSLQRLVIRPDYLRPMSAGPYLEIHLSGAGKIIPHDQLAVHGVLYVHQVADSAHLTAHVEETSDKCRRLHLFMPQGFTSYFLHKLTSLGDLGKIISALTRNIEPREHEALNLNFLMPEDTTCGIMTAASAAARVVEIDAIMDGHELQARVRVPQHSS